MINLHPRISFISRPSLALGILAYLFCQCLSGEPVRVPVAPYLNGAFPEGSPEYNTPLRLKEAFSGNLTFDEPMGFVPIPGGPSLFVLGKKGMIWLVERGFGDEVKKVALDIRLKTETLYEMGLQSLALHPEFGEPESPNRGFVYLIYTTNPGNNPPLSSYQSRWRLSRFTIQDPESSLSIDPNSELILIEQFAGQIHHGGSLFFGPSDRFLYFSVGDSGNLSNTQQIDLRLFSGVFRIDVDMDESRSHPISKQPFHGTTAHYYIPNDNPFVGEPGALGEFFALGLRNPYRVSPDSKTGKIYCGEVGGNLAEEINLIVPGGNYQWPFKEGNTSRAGQAPPETLYGHEQTPLKVLGRNVATAVIGGIVYRKPDGPPELIGKYVYADYRTGIISSLHASGDGAVSASILAKAPLPPPTNPRSGAVITGFSQDHHGELYLHQLDSNGKFFRLIQNDEVEQDFPELLSETGAFVDTAALIPSPVMTPYEVNSPLWSDGAAKKRWVIIPNDGPPYEPASEQAVWSERYDWFFPAGTVFVKHFELPIDEQDPTKLRRLETRFLIIDSGGNGYGVTYRWREDQSDAELVDFDGFEEDIQIKTREGVRSQLWSYPGTAQCLQCHTPQSRYVLGANTRQLNRAVQHGASQPMENQLLGWSASGLINQLTLGDLDQAPALSDLDEAAPLEHKIRSYLDANCSNCHQPGGVRALFDARFDTPLVAQGLLFGRTMEDPLHRLMLPGAPDDSYLIQRFSQLGPGQMPPLSKNILHQSAIQELRNYLQTLDTGSFLPSPWEQNEIGPSFNRGLAQFHNGVFTLGSAGFPKVTNDQLLFVHTQIDKDFDIRARVGHPRLAGENNIIFAGIMLRENLSGGSPTYFMADTGQNRISTRVGKRTTQNSRRTLKTVNLNHSPYQRVTRNGNTVRSYVSNDGTSWTLEDVSEDFSTSNELEVGLYFAGHTDIYEEINSITFEELSLSKQRVNLIANNRIAVEGGDPKGTFVLSRTEPLDDHLTVSFEWSGSGANTADVLELPASATFAPGENEIEISIEALNDAEDDVAERLTVNVNPNTRFLAPDAPISLGLGEDAFNAWRGLHFDESELSNQTLSGPLADIDGDQLLTIQEFFMGTNPKEPETNVIQTWIEDDAVHLKYPRSIFAADLGATAQMSQSLRPDEWTEANLEVVATDRIGDQVWTTFRDQTPVSSSNSLFLRLKIERE